MGEVISLQERIDQRAAEEHARALVLFECASILARRRHPGLLKLVEQAFTREELQERTRALLLPRRMRQAEKYSRGAQKSPPVAQSSLERK
jgi:hypothetical protein